MKRTISRAVLLASAVLLAACTIQINTTIQPDGAGELRTEMGFSPVDQEALSGIGTSPEDFCADMQSQENPDQEAPVRVEERGDEVWCVVTLPFSSLDELRDLYAGMGGVTINTLAMSSGELVYDVQVEFAEEEAEGFGQVDLSYLWQVTMPGLVSTHNADSADGSTLTWEVGLGETINAQAASSLSGPEIFSPGAGGLGWTELTLIVFGLLCCCGLLVVAAGAAAYLLVRRRQSGATPPAA